MVHNLSVALISFISSLGYAGIMIAMFFESACIPLPSEVILPFAGFLAYQGKITMIGAIVFGTLGGLIGSVFMFYIGLYGGRPLVKKYGKYVLIDEKKFDVAEKWFNNYGDLTVFFTRIMPVVRTFISLPAGIARMNFGKFIFYTFLGSIPWSILLVYIGYKLGQNWEELGPIFHYMDYLIVVLIAALIIYFIVKNINKSKKN